MSTIKWKTGDFIFLQSKRQPVFNRFTPSIRWAVGPKKGQAFLFMRPGDATPSNTSTVQRVVKFKGGKVLETMNSTYVLLEDSDDN